MTLATIIKKATLSLGLGLALASSGCTNTPSPAQNGRGDGNIKYDGVTGEREYDGGLRADGGIKNDGLDNNCDGINDNDLTPLSRECSAGIGECRRAGLEYRVCEGGAGWSADYRNCDAVAGASAEEICDGLDNDCDGLVDNSLTPPSRECFTGVGECRAAGLEYQVCESVAGWSADYRNCDAVAGAPAGEICDGLDNDCDGTADNALTVISQECLAGIGECRRAGLEYQVCEGVAGWSADYRNCDAVAGAPAGEICDGLDNDCDSIADNNLTAPSQECFAGIGECRRAGLEYRVCEGVAGWSLDYRNCDAIAGVPIEEIGWDGLDQDCDGEDYACPYIVDGNYSGLDGETGSPTNPWNTIQEAIDSANPDYCDLILVLPKTYYENIIVNKRLTIQSRDGAESTTIAGESLAATIYSEYSRIAIDGFTITGGYGIYSFNSRLTIKHNILQENRYGISIFFWAGAGGGNIGHIHNNIIVGNEGGDEAGGISFRQGGTLTIENNVIVGNAANLWGGGIFLDNWVHALVQNNIIAFNSPEGLRAFYSYTDLTNQYNCLFSNEEGDYAGSAAPGPGELIADPLFVNFTNDGNWSNDDYHLQEDSPCRNAGNPDAEYDDADGTRNDIGAYGGPEGDW